MRREFLTLDYSLYYVYILHLKQTILRLRVAGTSILKSSASLDLILPAPMLMPNNRFILVKSDCDVRLH